MSFTNNVPSLSSTAKVVSVSNTRDIPPGLGQCPHYGRFHLVEHGLFLFSSAQHSFRPPLCWGFSLVSGHLAGGAWHFVYMMTPRIQSIDTIHSMSRRLCSISCKPCGMLTDYFSPSPFPSAFPLPGRPLLLFLPPCLFASRLVTSPPLPSAPSPVTAHRQNCQQRLPP